MGNPMVTFISVTVPGIECTKGMNSDSSGRIIAVFISPRSVFIRFSFCHFSTILPATFVWPTFEGTPMMSICGIEVSGSSSNCGGAGNSSIFLRMNRPALFSSLISAGELKSQKNSPRPNAFSLRNIFSSDVVRTLNPTNTYLLKVRQEALPPTGAQRNCGTWLRL